MIQVKLLYFITFLLSFNCLIIAFHNNRGPWKVGWSNPNWCINCSKVAINRASCLGRSFRTDGYYLGKIAAELCLTREAEVPIFNTNYMKMCTKVPRPGHTEEALCWNASQGAHCERSVLRGGTGFFKSFLFHVLLCYLLVMNLTIINLLWFPFTSWFCMHTNKPHTV